ncbi:MAG TPA: copper amine oxidase N-terminal domain-containing protein, partial [Clostridia bacterium]
DYDLNGQKKQMDTAAMLKDGRTFVPARYVAEAFGATVRWDSAIRTVYIEITKVTNPTSGTHNVSGFVVPNDTNLSVTVDKHSETVETHFSIDFLGNDVEKQKDDLEKMLEQKFDATTIKQIMDCIRPKMKPTDTIEEKYFYDKKTGQYIYLPKSWPLDNSMIELYIYKKGIDPN